MCAYIPSHSYRNPVYQPAMRVIASITNAIQPTVTTTLPHQYLPGLIVRFEIPLLLGMQQLNQQVGTIESVPTPTTFTIDIDTQYYDAFTPPISFPPPYQDGQVVPVGEVNDQIFQAVRNVLNPNDLP